MPIRADGPGTVTEIDRWSGGAGWIAHPTEAMERTSHALATDGGLWLVDPVEATGLDAWLDDLAADTGVDGVAGVAVCYDNHRRDAAAIARRHDLPVHLPEWVTNLADGDIAAPVERFEGSLPGTAYRSIPLLRNRFMQEAALWDGETLLVPESLGTAGFFRANGERLGVSMLRRPVPPRDRLGPLSPERILCSHGEGVTTDAAAALETALGEARRNAPALYREYLPLLVRMIYAATTA
jgi:hypothetical protein